MEQSPGRAETGDAGDTRAPLFLLFQVGGDRYALDAQRIVEVLPLVRFKRIPRAPTGIAGVFDYRGAPVPVVDLSELMIGRATEQRLSSRLVVVDRAGAGSGERRTLGLLVEKATETLRRHAAEFVAAGVAASESPYLGPVSADRRGFIQQVDVDRLLPPAVLDALSDALAEAP